MEQDNRNNQKETQKDAKGKGVATRLDNSSSSSTRENGHPSTVEAASPITSVTTRLGASANKLTGDMIRHPSDAQIANVLPSSKAESSSAPRGGVISEASTYKSGLTPATFDGTFKSTQVRGQHAPGESSFSSFLNSTSTLEVMEPGYLDREGRGQRNDLEPGQMSQSAAIMATDGMDVVSLLDSGYDEVEDAEFFLTDDERVALRHRLFENGEASRRNPQRVEQWENILNFFPDIKTNSNGIQEYADLLGTSDLEEARSIWINQWQRVLSSYTDEVWGDLTPLVDEAREELTSLSRSREASPAKPKALRRLQQILHHVRGD